MLNRICLARGRNKVKGAWNLGLGLLWDGNAAYAGSEDDDFSQVRNFRKLHMEVAGKGAVTKLCV